MRIDFVTLFPEVVRAFRSHSVLGRAAEAGRVAFREVNPRDFAYDRHAKVDDVPFGGQAGMLLKPEPVALAIESVRTEGAAVVIPEPAARRFTQEDAGALARFDQVIFVCGHYEGIDERVLTRFATHRFSVGDFILTNGEIPAVLMADAAVRLLPGVLGSSVSLDSDSYANGLLAAPNYTRPEEWRGERVPEVLRSGDHGKIARWRRAIELRQTRELRPDLFARAPLEPGDADVLDS